MHHAQRQQKARARRERRKAKKSSGKAGKPVTLLPLRPPAAPVPPPAEPAHRPPFPTAFYGHTPPLEIIPDLCRDVRRQGGEWFVAHYGRGYVVFVSTVPFCRHPACRCDHKADGTDLLWQFIRDREAGVPMRTHVSPGWGMWPRKDPHAP